MKEKKDHHHTIKICPLQIWKKRSTLDGNLNTHYIWQNKEVSSLQIFKGQNLIIVLALVIFYWFEATCLIIFLYQFIYQFYQSIDSFFVGMAKITNIFYSSLYIYLVNQNFCTDSVYLDTRSAFTKTKRLFLESCSI